MAGNGSPRRATPARRMLIGVARVAALVAVITGISGVLAPDLTRAAWFYAAAAGGSIALIGALDVVQSRKRRAPVTERAPAEAEVEVEAETPLAARGETIYQARIEDSEQLVAAAREQERKQWAGEVARSVEAVRRAREEMTSAEAVRADLQQKLGEVTRTAAELRQEIEQRRVAANEQAIRADGLIAQLNSELATARSAIAQAAGREQQLRKQYEAETKHLQSAASSALEEIQRFRAGQDEAQRRAAREKDELRAQLELEWGEKVRKITDGLSADHERDVAALTAERDELARRIEEERAAREQQVAAATKSLQQELTAVHSYGDELARRVEELAAKVGAERSAREQAVGTATALQKQIDSANAEHAREVRLLSGRVQELERALETERAANERARGETVGLSSRAGDLEQQLADRDRIIAEARASHERLEAEWNDKLQKIVAGMAADHENDIGTAMEQREEARAEARSLTQRVQELQRKVDAERAAVEGREAEWRAKLDALARDHDVAIAEERATRARLEGEWNEKLQKIVAGMAADHENDIGNAMEQREAARAEARSLTQRVQDLQRSMESEREERTRLEGEWNDKLQKIVAGMAADHENDIGTAMEQREAARAEARSLTQRVQDLTRSIESEREERARLESEWNEKLQKIVAGMAADHEHDVGETMMQREEARAEARSLAQRVKDLQRAVENERAERNRLESDSGQLASRLEQLQRELDEQRARTVDESAVRSKVDEEWSQKLQTIVTHLASDHEADIGKAMEEKEEARAEARTLGLRVTSLQQQIERDRQALATAEQKFMSIRDALIAKAEAAQRELANLRDQSAAAPAFEPEPFPVTRVPTPAPFPSPFGGDEQRARADVLEIAEQAHAVLKRTAPGTLPLPAPVMSEGRRPMILFVHHDPNMRTMWRDQLHKNGYDVITAIDGLEGLRLATAHKPDVVIADAQMPKMDGRELCQLLKSNQDTAAIKIVLMSGMYTEERAIDSADQGFAPDELLRKPVKLDALQAALANVLSGEVGKLGS